MEPCCLEFLGFVGILRESIKLLLLSKNVKLIATITTINILLKTLLASTFIFYTKPVNDDLLFKQALLFLYTENTSHFDITDHSSGIKDDIRILLGVKLAFFLVSFTVSLFSIASMVLASAVTYSKKTLSFKDLLSRMAKSYVRPLVTSLQIHLIGICYMVLLFLALMVSLAIVGFERLRLVTLIIITFSILASVSWIYLSVIWKLALVISVIEESCYGTAALGKASRLVRGKRLHGFALNLLFLLPLAITIQIRVMNAEQNCVSTQIIIWFLLSVMSCPVMMLQWMSFTVMYFRCKKTHGEAIELQGSIEEYSKIPSAPHLIEDIV